MSTAPITSKIPHPISPSGNESKNINNVQTAEKVICIVSAFFAIGCITAFSALYFSSSPALNYIHPGLWIGTSALSGCFTLITLIHIIKNAPPSSISQRPASTQLRSSDESSIPVSENLVDGSDNEESSSKTAEEFLLLAEQSMQVDHQVDQKSEREIAVDNNVKNENTNTKQIDQSSQEKDDVLVHVVPVEVAASDTYESQTPEIQSTSRTIQVENEEKKELVISENISLTSPVSEEVRGKISEFAKWLISEYPEEPAIPEADQKSKELMEWVRKQHPFLFSAPQFQWLKVKQKRTQDNLTSCQSMREAFEKRLCTHWKECVEGYPEGKVLEKLAALSKRPLSQLPTLDQIFQETMDGFILAPFFARLLQRIEGEREELIRWFTDSPAWLNAHLIFVEKYIRPQFNQGTEFILSALLRYFRPLAHLMGDKPFEGRAFLLHQAHRITFQGIPDFIRDLDWLLVYFAKKQEKEELDFKKFKEEFKWKFSSVQSSPFGKKLNESLNEWLIHVESTKKRVREKYFLDQTSLQLVFPVLSHVLNEAHSKETTDLNLFCKEIDGLQNAFKQIHIDDFKAINLAISTFAKKLRPTLSLEPSLEELIKIRKPLSEAMQGAFDDRTHFFKEEISKTLFDQPALDTSISLPHSVQEKEKALLETVLMTLRRMALKKLNLQDQTTFQEALKIEIKNNKFIDQCLFIAKKLEEKTYGGNFADLFSFLVPKVTLNSTSDEVLVCWRATKKERFAGALSQFDRTIHSLHGQLLGVSKWGVEVENKPANFFGEYVAKSYLLAHTFPTLFQNFLERNAFAELWIEKLEEVFKNAGISIENSLKPFAKKYLERIFKQLDGVDPQGQETRKLFPIQDLIWVFLFLMSGFENIIGFSHWFKEHGSTIVESLEEIDNPGISLKLSTIKDWHGYLNGFLGTVVENIFSYQGGFFGPLKRGALSFAIKGLFFKINGDIQKEEIKDLVDHCIRPLFEFLLYGFWGTNDKHKKNLQEFRQDLMDLYQSLYQFNPEEAVKNPEFLKKHLVNTLSKHFPAFKDKVPTLFPK